MKKDILIYFFGKIIPALVNLAIIILGVRFLGEEQYGKYSLIFSGILLISNVSFTWIQQSMIRFLSGYKEKPGEAISRFFYLTAASTLAGAGVLVMTCLFYFRLQWPEMVAVVLYLILSVLFLFRLTLYQSLIRPVKYALYEVSYNLFLLLFFLGFVYIFVFRNFIILFISMGAGLVMAEIIHRIALLEKPLRIDLKKFHRDKQFTAQAMDYGFTLTIWIMVFTLTAIADRYVIKEFQNYAAVGTYAAMKDLVTKISTFSILPVFLAFNAKINDAWNHGEEARALKLVKQALKIEFLVCIVVVAGFILFRDLLYTRILHLKGDGLFVSSIFLIAGAFLWQGALIIHKPLELLMKQRSMVCALLAGMIVNLGANLIFVPYFGFSASAVISFSTALLYVILALLLSRRSLKRYHQAGNTPEEPGPDLFMVQ